MRRTRLVELRWTQLFPVGTHQFDNVVLDEADPAVRSDCVDGGWQLFGFSNQGQCVRLLETGKDRR